VMIARTAVASSRVDAIHAALGMGVGGLFFAVVSLLGLHGLLLAVPSLYWVLKILGGSSPWHCPQAAREASTCATSPGSIVLPAASWSPWD